MKSFRSFWARPNPTLIKGLWLILILLVLVGPVCGQRRPSKKAATEPPPPQQNVSFDNLLAAESYKIYGEVRSVGVLLHSEGVKDLVDPIVKLSAPPREFKSLVKWLNARADALQTSRLLFAAWPSRPKLPQYLVAIEFPSVEEAQKFEPQLKDFLPKLLPSPSPESSPVQKPGTEAAEAKDKETAPGPNFILKQEGPLVFISDTPLTLKDLKPKGSKLLAEDQNFRIAHDRFNADSIFFYIDFASIEKEEKLQRQKVEEERARVEAEREAQKSKPQPAEEATNDSEEEVAAQREIAEAAAASNDSVKSGVIKGVVVSDSSGEQKPNQADQLNAAFGSLVGSLFGGGGKWPEGIGASLVFDGDSYVARVLLINSPSERTNAIPFFPLLISGPLLVPEAPAVLPADTELFVSASLDFPQIHEGMIKTVKAQFEQMQKYQVRSGGNTEPLPAPFDAIEKKLGIKIKDDLLPLLGNEIAFTIPMKVIDGGPPEAKPSPDQSKTGDTQQNKTEVQGPSVVLAVSIRDREGVKALLPRIFDSLGLKGAGMIAQPEKRDDTELISFGNMFAYAFIGDFLIVSPDVKATRHVVDSYLKHETLSSSSPFRNYTRWQPRQVLGQIYLSPALMESYNSYARDGSSQISDQLRDFLMMLSPVAQPVTYALSNEGQGPLHELHVPKNLLMFLIAGISGDTNASPLVRNESATRDAMRAIASAEATYQSTEGAGRYGSLDELIKAELIPQKLFQNLGYKVEVSISNTRYEVTAVPLEYGKTGKLSFFLDETSVLRAGDHGGAPATISDKAAP